MNRAAVSELRGLEGRQGPLSGEVDPEVPKKRRHISRPAHRHGACADGIFEHERPADDPADKFTERGVSVGIGAARYRDHAGEFGVAHARKSAAQGSDHKTDDNSGACIIGRSNTGQRKKAGADDGADAERDETPGPERAFQRVSVRLSCKLRDPLPLEHRSGPRHCLLFCLGLQHPRLHCSVIHRPETFNKFSPPAAGPIISDLSPEADTNAGRKSSAFRRQAAQGNLQAAANRPRPASPAR